MHNKNLDSIFITFSKSGYPVYSKISHQIFTKLYTQLKIYQNDKNQLKNLLKHTIRVTSAIRPWWMRKMTRLGSKFAPDSTNFAPIFQVPDSTLFASIFQVKRWEIRQFWKKVVFLFVPIIHLFSGHFLSPSRN